MPDTFLHGVETIDSPAIATVNNVKTAVIGLIGTAVSGDVNKLKVCVSENDDVQWGTTGTIPAALKAIRTQGAATVVVISIGTGTPTPVAADFIGAVTNGVRTGMKLYDECYTQFQFVPKIFIAPGYSTLTGMVAALKDVAEKHRGCAYVDAAAGTTVTGAITLRATNGAWATTSRRLKLLYPMIKPSSGVSDYFSAYAAGLRAYVDYSEGFWVSSSNHEIKGITGLEVNLSASINDATCDVNTLNAAGITTVFPAYGSFKEWGNRNASFPTAIDPQSFECVQRTKDIIDESIELAMFPYIDKPLNQANIDAVRNTVNNYFNVLIARGALMEGSKCTYNPAKNPADQLAAGHVVFTNVYMSPTPAERITFDTSIDINLLANLG